MGGNASHCLISAARLVLEARQSCEQCLFVDPPVHQEALGLVGEDEKGGSREVEDNLSCSSVQSDAISRKRRGGAILGYDVKLIGIACTVIAALVLGIAATFNGEAVEQKPDWRNARTKQYRKGPLDWREAMEKKPR